MPAELGRGTCSRSPDPRCTLRHPAAGPTRDRCAPPDRQRDRLIAVAHHLSAAFCFMGLPALARRRRSGTFWYELRKRRRCCSPEPASGSSPGPLDSRERGNRRSSCSREIRMSPSSSRQTQCRCSSEPWPSVLGGSRDDFSQRPTNRHRSTSQRLGRTICDGSSKVTAARTHRRRQEIQLARAG